MEEIKFRIWILEEAGGIFALSGASEMGRNLFGDSLFGRLRNLPSRYNVALSTCIVYLLESSIRFGGVMKKWAWILAIPVLSSILSAQTSSPASTQEGVPTVSSQATWHEAGPGDRMFFPHDMFWGWAQLDLAPPHNEVDPNLCAGNSYIYGGANAPCSMFARYMLSGILEVRPFGRGPLRRFMVFGAPNFLFGKNVPKTLYTWSPDAIGVEHSWGAGIYIDKGFEFRVTQHFLFDRLGARDKNLGPADLGNNGPWGRYMTLGVRKTFGTRRW